MKSFLALAALALPLASAHFTLDFPLSRGFDEDIEPQFCGGFPSVRAPRQVFPLGPGPILIDSHHPSAVVAILISFDQNPTTFGNFNQTSAGVPIPLLKNFGTITGEGEYCFPVNVGALGVAGVGNGTLATIQVEFTAGDGTLFQCTDVILSSTYTASNVSCVNGTGLTTTSTAATTNSSSSPSVASNTTTAAKAGAMGTVQLSAAASLLAGAVALVLL